MSQLIFDSHVNNDIEDALHYIFAADKNAIQDFLKKVQGEKPNVNVGVPSQSIHNQNVDPYSELLQKYLKADGNSKYLQQELKSKEDDYKKLEDEYNKLSSNLDDKEKEIDALKTNIDTLREEKDTFDRCAEEAEKKANSLEDELTKYKKDAEKKLLEKERIAEQRLKEKESELSRKYHEEIKRLQNEIKELRKTLEKYEVPSGTTGETKYFDVYDNSLCHTLSDDVPYVGEVLNDGKISYQFNNDKGKVQEAIQKRETILDPFCDITSAIDGGNAIQWVERGLLAENGGTYVIEKKAKIKIVLQ